MRDSTKHHYVPVFYLKGFTDAEGYFYVYDKLTKKTWKSKPENAFFENQRNTGILQYQEGDDVFTSDELEKAFADVDNAAAKVIQLIKKSRADDHILSTEALLHVRYFINSLFWRSPANDELKKAILKSDEFKGLNNGYFMVNTKDGYRQPDDVYHNTDLLRKMYSIFLPGASFKNDFVRYNSKDWRLYYGAASHGLISDNPVILEPFKDFASLHENVIFKISSQIILVSTSRYKPDILSPLFCTRIDFLLYEQANRFVACSSQTYLQQIITYCCKLSKTPGWTQGLFKQIFDAFY